MQDNTFIRIHDELINMRYVRRVNLHRNDPRVLLVEFGEATEQGMRSSLGFKFEDAAAAKRALATLASFVSSALSAVQLDPKI